MQIKTKSGRLIEVPDEGTFEASDAEFKRMKPMGRPRSEVTKERVTIRLSPEVVESFRATGKGWQTRMDRALKEYVETHSQGDIERLG